MKHYHKNPRQITAAQFERLQETLAELGDLSGIVHDLNSDEIIGGNQRLEALGLMNATPEVVERYDAPTETGTVALGYYIVNGERFSYRAVRWTPEQCEKANIVANLAGGDWNWDALASWDVSALVSWGFDTEALQGWNNDAANLREMINAELPPQDVDDLWKDMPEFEQEDLSGIRLIVHFETSADMMKFGELIGQSLTEKSKAIWYPRKEPADLKSIRYIEDES